MKIYALLFSLAIFNGANAQIETASASDICLNAANIWALQSEAKHTKTKIDKIKSVENRTIGSGANLHLMSIFVEGPNTGDNTHWEVVGEFSPKSNSCKILLGRRYWAH